MQKKLIHFNLMKERNIREIKKDESILEIEIKLVNPHWNLQRSELCHLGPYKLDMFYEGLEASHDYFIVEKVG